MGTPTGFVGQHLSDLIYIFIPKLLVTQKMVNRTVYELKADIPLETIDDVEYRALLLYRYNALHTDIFDNYVWYEYQTGEGFIDTQTGVTTVYSNTSAATINGTDEFFDGGTAFNFARGEGFSITGWLKLGSASNDSWIGRFASNAGYVFQVLSDGTLRFKAGASGIDAMSGDSTLTVTSNAWVHCALVYAGTGEIASDGVKMFIDGVKDTIDVNTDNSTSDWAGSRSFFIGKDAGGNFLATKLDEIKIWDTALSDAEVSEDFNSGSPVDPEEHSKWATNCVGDWRFGGNPADDFTHSTGQITDNTTNGNDLTPNNTSSSNEISDAP